MRRLTPRRGGFTLVELLVVVGLLAVVAAIATAAFLRVRGSEEVRATEATLQKLKSELDRKWRAVLDDAAEDSAKGRIPPGLVAFAGNDQARARAVWTYLKLKNELPTTVAEATTPIPVPLADGTGAVTTDVTLLPAKRVFVDGFRKQIPGATGNGPFASQDRTANGSGPLESAACFQWALTATATRGEVAGADGLNQQTGDVAGEIRLAVPANRSIASPRTFKDSYGNPIVFVRQAYLAGELDRKPYVQPGATQFHDPLDPKGRLVTLDLEAANAANPNAWTRARLAFFWNTVLNPEAARHWDYDGVTFRAGDLTYPGQAATADSGRPRSAANWVPTVASAGANKQLWHQTGSNFGADDDLFSFRLTRDGKGN
jgi:prepilin-type N-terminal cleavage/methylation domain-containing protein